MVQIKSDMAGIIESYLVEVGQQVESGKDVCIIESMKTLMTVKSPESGIVKEIKVEPGEFIEDGDVIMELE